MKKTTWSLGALLNRVQSTFVGLLRVCSIPIVLLLSVASGYTTYYGMSHFITWWIALIITIAVQSILVICSLEIAGIHWKANRTRYLIVALSLLVAVGASVTFSYFKFYEISEKQTLHIERLEALRRSIDHYLEKAFQIKSELIGQQLAKGAAAEQAATLAYMGTHPEIPPKYRNQVGKGPFWYQYNALFEGEQERLKMLRTGFDSLGGRIGELRQSIRHFELDAYQDRDAYLRIMYQFQAVQNLLDELVTGAGRQPPEAPALPSHAQLTENIKPSFAMWQRFSWFALACAVMVDFFTFLLSYRLEFTAPGPLTEEEQDLAYQCLSQFTELKINRDDELELVIEKSELERARRVSDWNRVFGAAFLLSRGYLRKVSDRSVEFAPNLYPVIAERMLKGRAPAATEATRTPAGDFHKVKELAERMHRG